MAHKLNTLVPLACALAFGASTALAAESGPYLGGNFGQSNSDASASDVGAGFSGTIDDSDSAWKLVAGYQVNRNLAIEGAYVDLGTNSAAGTLGGVTIGGAGDMTGWQLGGVVAFPVGDSVSIFGRVGLFMWDLDASGALGGVSAFVKDDGTDISFGAGIDYRMSDNVSLRGEWERFKLGSDTDLEVDMFSAGVLVRF